MLETIREFAAERVELSAFDELRTSHAEFYLRVAEAIAPGLRGDDQGHLLALVETDLGNYRAALSQLLAKDEVVALLRLATALSDFWWQRGHPREGLDWSLRALERNPDPTPLRAEALRVASELSMSSGDSSARALAMESVSLSRQLGLDPLLARCLNNLGAFEIEAQNLDSAADLFNESAEIRRREGDRSGLARTLGNLALVEMKKGNLTRARALAEECLELPEYPFDRANGHATLGALALAMDDLESATRSFGTAVRTFAELQALQHVAMVLVSLARVAVRAEEYERACCLLAAASRVEESVDPIVDADSVAEKEEVLEALQRSLDRPEFDEVWSKGRAMTLDQTVEYALARESR
jgi:non-specific serine/threonine protein kinase